MAASLGEAQAQMQSIQADANTSAPLRTLEVATGKPAVVEGWRIPESKPARAGMLGLFGLLLGIGGALAADRLDTRVRDKEDAERAFDLPVIAEIPPLPSGTKGRELLRRPRGRRRPFVEAYRALRTVVLFAAASGEASAARPGPAANGNGNGHDATASYGPSPGRGSGAAHHLAVRGRGQDHDGRPPRRPCWPRPASGCSSSAPTSAGPGSTSTSACRASRGCPTCSSPGPARSASPTSRWPRAIAACTCCRRAGPVDNPAQLLTESSGPDRRRPAALRLHHHRHATAAGGQRRHRAGGGGRHGDAHGQGRPHQPRRGRRVPPRCSGGSTPPARGRGVRRPRHADGLRLLPLPLLLRDRPGRQPAAGPWSAARPPSRRPRTTELTARRT